MMIENQRRGSLLVQMAILQYLNVMTYYVIAVEKEGDS